MRAFTASYTGRWLGRRSMSGDTTFLEPSRSGAGEAAKGAVLPPSWLCGARLPSVRRVLPTAGLPDWEADLMLFRTYGHAVLTITDDRGKAPGVEVAQGERDLLAEHRTFFCASPRGGERYRPAADSAFARRTWRRCRRRFTQLIQAYNNTPRKCLGYRTPAEIFFESVLHLKCESTAAPPRGWIPALGGRNDGWGLGMV